MVVKKTKSGKYSFELTNGQRNVLFECLINFLENESVALMNVKLKDESMRHLRYSILNEFITKQDFHLSVNVSKRWTLKRSEAIALMWLLKDDNTIAMLAIKSSLHKTLS